MDRPDYEFLRTLVLAHGLYEVLVSLSRICDEFMHEKVPYDAHMAQEWAYRSQAIDEIAAEMEGAEAGPVTG